jgi:hypothetical protein
VSNGLLVVADEVSVLTGKTHSERGDEGLRKSHVASILEYETMEDWKSVTVTLAEPVTTNTTGSMISVLVCHLFFLILLVPVPVTNWDSDFCLRQQK